MYFFKVELSLFDEDKETIFLVPNTDTLEKDELPVFSENELTAHPKFTVFVKRTKTAIVDVAYELYEAKDVVFDEMDAGKFEQLLDRNKLELLDGNEFCIQTKKIKYKRKKNKSLFPKIGIGAAVLLLIVGAMAKKMRSKTEPLPEPTSEIASDVLYSSESDDVTLSAPEVTESVAQLPESSVTSTTSSVTSATSSVTTSSVQTKPKSSAVSSSAATSTAVRSTAQSSSAAPAVSLQTPIETSSSQ